MHRLPTHFALAFLLGLSAVLPAQVTPVWQEQLSLGAAELLRLPAGPAIAGNTADGSAVLAHYTPNGQPAGQFPLEDFGLPSAAVFDSTDGTIYVAGIHPDLPGLPLVVSSVEPDGTTVWSTQDVPGSWIYIPYAIERRDSVLLLIVSRFSLNGAAAGYGFRLLDTAGDFINEYILPLPGFEGEWVTQSGAFAPDGNVLIAASNIIGEDSAEHLIIYKIQRETGAILWQQAFAYPYYTTLNAVHVAADGSSYWTGEGGRLIAMSANGAVLYDQPLKSDGLHNGFDLAARSDGLYVFGDWTKIFENPFSLDSRLFIGKYDWATGLAEWGWEWEDSTAGAADPYAWRGYFADDSTMLIVYRSLGTEFEYLGEFRLTGMSAVSRPHTGRPEALKITPNPAADGRITVAYNGSPGWLTVYDATGRLVQRIRQEADAAVIVPAAGLYWLEWTDGRRRSVAKVLRP
jgi:hypothetical protein